MPLVCINVLNKKAENLDLEDAEMSYTGLLIAVFVINLLQFIARPRIYITENVESLYEKSEEKDKDDKVDV